MSISRHSNRDSKVLRSVGIDIGSTTTHLIFSKLTLELNEKKHKFDIVDREITNVSKIFITPFQESNNIDLERLSSILISSYKAAGYAVDDIDTGAIIITGEAARKDNAQKIVNLFANQMGKFVCATAGPNYEAVLAAHGSGAIEWSRDDMTTVMNVDVGGGTSKIAIARRGKIVDTASLYVGARPVVFDEDGRLIWIQDIAEIVARATGIDLSKGARLSEENKRKLASTLANCLLEVMKRGELSDLTKKLMITQPLTYDGNIDTILFSGGVSEYIYNHINQEFGDLGIFLAEEIRQVVKILCIPVLEPLERIRATVIGASQYTLQVSGNTTFISGANLLPIRSLKVVAPHFNSKVLSKRAIEAKIRDTLEMHDIPAGEIQFALAFHRSVITQPSYDLMKKMAESVVAVLMDRLGGDSPMVLVFEADIGMGMGRVIKEELIPECRLISIDEVALQDYNYIDIGEPTEQGFIPVVVKSLVFPSSTVARNQDE